VYVVVGWYALATHTQTQTLEVKLIGKGGLIYILQHRRPTKCRKDCPSFRNQWCSAADKYQEKQLSYGKKLDKWIMCGYTHTLIGRSISTHALTIAHRYVSGDWVQISIGRTKQSYPYIGFIYFNVRCTMLFLIND
jgi:hypothetical protein